MCPALLQARQEVLMPATGTVKFWKVGDKGGYGFAQVDGIEQDVFFQEDHYCDVTIEGNQPGMQKAELVYVPVKGDMLCLEIVEGPKGPRANRWTYFGYWQDIVRLISVRDRKNDQQVTRPRARRFETAQAVPA